MRQDTADLSVRPHRADDTPFLESLSERVFSVYSRDPTGTMASMSDDADAVTLVGELGRTRVGFVVVSFEQLSRDFGPWSRPVLARLDAIAVRPDAQGRGIGRALLASAEEAARARQARTLSLMTAESNARARALFESAGFFGLLRIERAYARGQRAVTMMKPLLDL
jgi:ribosomal protein S18 acetylase RimI-like enzyme